MSALKRLFNKKVNQCSPVVDDMQRVVNYGPDGEELVTFEKVDLRKFQVSLGSVKVWSLQSLLSAGISPDFPIRTGLVSRLEGVGVVNDAMNFVNSLSDNGEDLPVDEKTEK